MAAPGRVVLLAGALCLCLTGCEGGGPISSAVPPTLSVPTLTRSSAPEPSASQPDRPSLTLPTRSEAAPAPTQTAAPTPTAAPPTQTPTPTAAQPTQTPTRTAIALPTQTSTPRPAPTPTSTPVPVSTPAEAAASSSSSSAWLWWLLGLLVALAAVALVVLLVRGRRRKAWDTQLAGAVAESAWLARELLPAALSAENAAARRNLWTAYRPRVGALENGLSALAVSAPKNRLGSLDRLRAAVTGLSSAMDAYTAADTLDDRESLGAARQAQQQLEEALRALRTGEPDRTEPATGS
jgi:hypothetical protein